MSKSTAPLKMYNVSVYGYRFGGRPLAGGYSRPAVICSNCIVRARSKSAAQKCAAEHLRSDRRRPWHRLCIESCERIAPERQDSPVIPVSKRVTKYVGP